MITDRPLIKVRRAKPGDAKALANVFCESWRSAYTGIIPFMHLQQMVRARDATWWQNAIRREGDILVLEVESVVAGYATFGPARNQTGTKPIGEIYELYFLPVYQGIGLGEHLFEACRAGLDHRRLNGLLVWALAANESAIAFYWRRGGRPVAKRADRVGNSKLDKIAFTWG